jgi:SNF2 family DNA or RNA helicase
VLKTHELFETGSAASATTTDTTSGVGGSPTAGGAKSTAAGLSKHYARAKFHVLLTSFEIAAKEAPLLKKFAWESLVVDEAHRLKSGARGQLFQATHGLETRHRLLLTGTPLQNTLEELFHLLFFLEPAKVPFKTCII